MQSLQKAARVLGAFSTLQPEWGVRALAAELGLPRATVHAYLTGLSDAGLLRRTPSGRYRLSWRLAEIGVQLSLSLPWFLPARGLVTELALDTQSVGFLCLLEGREVVCAIRERHPQADIDLPLDTYLPATSTASGKLLYAYAGLQPAHFDTCTPSSISTPDEWETEVSRVLARGYAYNIEEWLPGQCTLALPYLWRGDVVGAVGIQMTAERYLAHEAELRERVIVRVREHLAASVGEMLSAGR